MPLYPINISRLLSLDEDECKKFKEYLSSPYFNKTKRLLPLYELIVKEFKEHKKIYCEADFIQKAYGALKTSLYKSHLQEFGKHFRNFIAVQCFEQQPLLHNQLVLEDHLEREDGIFFVKQYRQTKKQLNELPLDINQFQNKYQIEILLDSYIKTYKDKRVGDANLQVSSDAIDRDFILKKLCCTVMMLNRSNITKAKYNFGMIQLVLKSLRENASFTEPLTKLFYYAYEILVGEDKENTFRKLNEELLGGSQKIARDMICALFSILQNNLKFLKDVNVKLYQQLFNLYSIMITQKYI